MKLLKITVIIAALLLVAALARAGEIEDLQAQRQKVDGQLNQLQGQAALIKQQVTAALESYGKVIGQAQLLIQQRNEIDSEIKALSTESE